MQQRHTVVIPNLSEGAASKLRDRLERSFKKTGRVLILKPDREVVDLVQTKNSQCKIILDHFRTGKAISSMVAFKQFNITSLSRRICDLKDSGHNIQDEWVRHNGKRYKRYWMDQPKQVKS